jgi:hypothetical protein
VPSSPSPLGWPVGQSPLRMHYYPLEPRKGLDARTCVARSTVGTSAGWFLLAFSLQRGHTPPSDEPAPISPATVASQSSCGLDVEAPEQLIEPIGKALETGRATSPGLPSFCSVLAEHISRAGS